MSTWRITSGLAQLLEPAAVPSEKDLEDLIEDNPELIFGEPLLIIGRQNSTDLQRPMDLLAIDRTGRLVIAELKKHRTPRDAIAQALEYASYISTLLYSQLDGIALEYFADRNKRKANAVDWTTLAEAFFATFQPGVDDAAVNDVAWNANQRIVVIAEKCSLDIISVCSYLRKKGLDMSAVEMQFYRDLTGHNIEH